jgi:hypothetical protein
LLHTILAVVNAAVGPTPAPLDGVPWWLIPTEFPTTAPTLDTRHPEVLGIGSTDWRISPGEGEVEAYWRVAELIMYSDFGCTVPLTPLIETTLFSQDRFEIGADQSATFDNNCTTVWASESKALDGWIGYRFSEIVSVQCVELVQSDCSLPTGHPNIGALSAPTITLSKKLQKCVEVEGETPVTDYECGWATDSGWVTSMTNYPISVPSGKTALPGAPGCVDTCPFSNDGVCDDGGPGSEYDASLGYDKCNYGADCRDCGQRETRYPTPFPTPPTTAPTPAPVPHTVPEILDFIANEHNTSLVSSPHASCFCPTLLVSRRIEFRLSYSRWRIPRIDSAPLIPRIEFRPLVSTACSG